MYQKCWTNWFLEGSQNGKGHQRVLWFSNRGIHSYEVGKDFLVNAIINQIDTNTFLGIYYIYLIYACWNRYIMLFIGIPQFLKVHFIKSARFHEKSTWVHVFANHREYKEDFSFYKKKAKSENSVQHLFGIKPLWRQHVPWKQEWHHQSSFLRNHAQHLRIVYKHTFFAPFILCIP